MQSTTIVIPMYALQDVPGKGKGLVAIENIPKGTRILSEEPIIVLPEGERDCQRQRTSIRQQVDALSAIKRQAFLCMHNVQAYKNDSERYYEIVRTNAFPIGADKMGIFLEACRINHACDNNAQKKWNGNIKRHTVHALRDIEKGEEITISYLEINQSHKARNETLKAKYNFTCSCRRCSLSLEQRQESDNRFKEIDGLDSLIGQGVLMGISSSPIRILRYIDRKVRLEKERGDTDVGLPRAFLDAAQVAIANGDLARGRIFAERAVSGLQTLYGNDCEEVLQYGPLALDPSNIEIYGMSMKWETAVDQAPTEKEPDDFEDWLWRREKPQCLGQPANFRNRANFPGFVDLPCRGTLQPRRHWCFLAEIVNTLMLARLSMDIKDVDGKTVPLFFYTDDRGRELASNAHKGYTVAILYAQSHRFKFDEPGIRHEEPQLMKVRACIRLRTPPHSHILTDRDFMQILPVSLDNLLALNDEVQEFSTTSNGLRTCHGCGKKGTTLQKCAKCSFFWYCDRV